MRSDAALSAPRRRGARSPVCVLAIGGLDPGGGAGLAADLRSFHALGVFGCAAVALITVQSTDGLKASYAVPPKRVVAQAAEVVRGQRVRAIKLGALGSVANVRAVARWLARVKLPMVLDPVMLPTRGSSRLLAERGVAALRDELLPLATIVTANAPEAEALTGCPVTTVAGARRAAERLVSLGATAALVKGGHLRSAASATDVLAVRGRATLELPVRRLDLPPMHGGGCVLASLIAAHLARSAEDGEAIAFDRVVRRARRTHQKALANLVDVGGAMRVLAP